MEKKWTYIDNPDQELTAKLAKSINLNKVLAGILVQRNIPDFESAKKFFRPELTNLYDPFLMKGMTRAVNRILEAMQKQENILIYGDYDVDGTTAVSLLYHYLRRHYPLVDYYIPDRYTEGYGLSQKGVDYALHNEVTLIITLDCGIKAHKLVSFGNDHGLDFIICDHHLPSETVPEALAVLDPKQEDCKYPFKELSGCGIGFKLIQALAQKLKSRVDVYDYLDLVAVSIASDIVPIVDENRVLAYHGLKLLNENPRPGLKALIKAAGLTEVDIMGIVFGIGPRINASGRIDHAYSSVELLLASDINNAFELTEPVNEHNLVRRNFDSNITQEALQMIENDPDLLSSKSTVLFKNTWHKGVIGIVASRCIEKFYRPTIILTEHENVVTGSARSVDGFNLYDALKECAELLDRFGGHQYAAGLSLSVDKVEAFKKKFEQVVSTRILADQLIPQVKIDSKITLDRINAKFYSVLKQFGPFGPYNMNPVFVAENLVCKGEAKVLKEQHLKLFVRQHDSRYALEAIGFGLGYLAPKLKNKKFNMAFNVELNGHNGMKYLQLNIKDIKFE
ncbi:MAG: single-stranded-DNA-specific exonuclease RecJ [Cyclobacteriaceae bacterium]